ncbi:MAG: DUF2149 domain-containing protein [Peptococcaceae bacterium]|nr:DUF2149 domain-containing protein [Peptococcaceae bacterium]
MQVKRKKRTWPEEEVDPRVGLLNLIDLMLVFAVGLLVSLVLSWNLPALFKTSAEERKEMLTRIQKVINVEKGRELREPPEIQKGGGAGYQEVGTVYRDLKTGKLIVVEN